MKNYVWTTEYIDKICSCHIYVYFNLIISRDICPLLKHPEAFSASIDLLTNHIKETYPDVELIIGMFFTGGFVPQRKFLQSRKGGGKLSIKCLKFV